MKAPKSEVLHYSCSNDQLQFCALRHKKKTRHLFYCHDDKLHSTFSLIKSCLFSPVIDQIEMIDLCWLFVTFHKWAQ